jgi:outer membrane receptor protein involved in Fe transport
MFKKILLTFAVICMIPMAVYSQTTGNIAGQIVDKATGDPLPGVNVTIDGTFRGAITDLDGFFRILNLPAGKYTTRASYIGYRETAVEGIRVSVDHTTPIDFQLEATTLELEEAIVVTAERDLIRRDETNTQIITTAEDIAIMPVRGIQQIASLTAGVVKAENNNAMNVRGGRAGEAAVYVDGVLVNDPYNNAVRVYLPNDAIEEMSVQTGGFNAEYGDAMSGIIITTTKAGTKDYHGTLEVITDGFLGKRNKEFGLGTYSYGYNEYTGSISGPIIPGMNHTFYLSGARRFKLDQTPSWGFAENENKPAEFKGGPIPGNKDEDWSASGKVRVHLTPEMDIRASGSWTDRTFSATYAELGDGSSFGMNPVWLYNTDHAPEWKTEHRSFNLTFTHTPSPTTYYDVKFNYFYTFRENYDPAFGSDLMKYGDPRFNPLDETIDGNYGTLYSTKVDPDFLAPGAQYDDYFKNKTTYFGVDIDVTHQMDKYNTLKAGLEYKYHTLRQYRMLSPILLASKSDLTPLERYRLADAQFYGYDMYGSEVDDGDYFNVKRDATLTPISGFDKQAPYNPIIMSAYFQDKIEFGDLVLNLGLRYDRIDPNAWQFKQLEADVDENGDLIPGTGTGMFGGNEIFDASDVEDSEVHQFISPRVGVAFPISENTVFHGQFGKFYQAPQLADLYLSPFYLDSWVNRGGYFTNLDNPNLEPPKTTSYEVGFKQALGNIGAFRLTAFYKETEGLVQVIPVQTDVTSIAFTWNGDFGVVKGLDVMLTLRRYKNFAAKFNYELQYANGTGAGTASNFDIAWQNGGQGNYPKFTQPLDYEQRHTGSLNLDYRLGKNEGPSLFDIRPLENTGLNLLFTFNSGRPYTRAVLENTFPFSGRYDNDGISEIPYTAVNTEVTPWNFRFDLRLDRRFDLPLGDAALTVFAYVLNVLNTGNVKDVWITTGLPDDSGYRSTAGGAATYNGYNAITKQNYRMREMDYFNYGIPRQIRIGAKIEF